MTLARLFQALDISDSFSPHNAHTFEVSTIFIPILIYRETEAQRTRSLAPESVFLTIMLCVPSTAAFPERELGTPDELALSGLRGTGEGKAVVWRGCTQCPAQHRASPNNCRMEVRQTTLFL